MYQNFHLPCSLRHSYSIQADEPCTHSAPQCQKIEFIPVSLPFVFGKPLNCVLTSTFANSEELYEMQHIAAFHQGLHCL